MSAAISVMSAALDRIAPASGERVFPPTLLPARTILELSGEAVRTRLCIFTDATGREFCLRPDMTTPIASMVASGELALARYHYAGSVYRLPHADAGDAIEFPQAGFEWFNGGGAAEDVEAAVAAIDAVRAAGGADSLMLTVGDVSLLRAVLDALPFSPAWRDRLLRAFFRKRGPRDLLAAASSGDGRSSALASALAAMPEADAVRAVEEILQMTAVQPVGGRGAGEIAARLRETVSDPAPDADAGRVLDEYLSLSTPVTGSVAKLEAFARAHGLQIAPALEALGERIEGLARMKPAFWKGAKFSALAGGRFQYYDGFVFDLCEAAAPQRPVMAGGRYDGLVVRLSGGAIRTGAIGAALRIDRLTGAGQ